MHLLWRPKTGSQRHARRSFKKAGYQQKNSGFVVELKEAILFELQGAPVWRNGCRLVFDWLIIARPEINALNKNLERFNETFSTSLSYHISKLLLEMFSWQWHVTSSKKL